MSKRQPRGLARRSRRLASPRVGDLSPDESRFILVRLAGDGDMTDVSRVKILIYVREKERDLTNDEKIADPVSFHTIVNLSVCLSSSVTRE